MENEHLNKGPEPSPKSTEEHSTADDLKFVRTVMEKTCRQIKPKTSNTVICGLIVMTIYIGTHFLIKNELCDWIRPLQISLISLGVIITWIQAHFLFKKLRQQGFVPQLLSSLSYGLAIMVLPVFFFDLLGLFKGMYCGPAFIYAFTANSAMALVGVLHSRLWFSGTILVTGGILIAFIVKAYSLLILGIAIGGGMIVSALIVDIYYRKVNERKSNG